MADTVEMEKKYLIRGKANDSESIPEEKLYEKMVQETISLRTIGEYSMSGYVKKERQYRYFDTFDTALTSSGIEAFIGPLEEEGISLSVRERKREEGMDYVLAVKFPKEDEEEEREEHEFPIPAGSTFDELDPNDFSFWNPLKRAKAYGRNKPFMEIIRLDIETYRFNLAMENEEKVQVALDSVKAVRPLDNRRFYELEIERLRYGENADVEFVRDHFLKKYAGLLHYAPNPKWIKALKLFRGEGLIQPSSDEEEDSDEEKE